MLAAVTNFPWTTVIESYTPSLYYAVHYDAQVVLAAVTNFPWTTVVESYTPSLYYALPESGQVMLASTDKGELND